MVQDRLMDIQLELERLKNIAINSVTKSDMQEVVKSIEVLDKRLEENRKVLNSLAARVILLITAVLGTNAAMNEGAGIRNLVRLFTS